jgi:hypothetical protein
VVCADPSASPARAKVSDRVSGHCTDPGSSSNPHVSAVVEAFDTFEGLRRPAQPALAAGRSRPNTSWAYAMSQRASLH